MAQVQKLQVATEIKSSADKFYHMFKDTPTELTKIYPEVYKGIEIVSGDSKTAGSNILWKYTLGNDVILSTKEKIVAVNDNERSITYQVIEGVPLNDFKSFMLKLHVTPSAAKWHFEYEKKNGNVEDPNLFLELLAKVSEKLDSHLLKA